LNYDFRKNNKLIKKGSLLSMASPHDVSASMDPLFTCLGPIKEMTKKPNQNQGQKGTTTTIQGVWKIPWLLPKPLFQALCTLRSKLFKVYR